MDLLKRIKLNLLWRREFARISGELDCYAEHELRADLNLNRSDIPAIAAQGADDHIAAHLRTHPSDRGLEDWDRLGYGRGFAF